MTAAATDGSTNCSTSDTLAVLVRPAMQEPGDRREERRDDVQGEEDLPDADAGQPRRDGVVADREQQSTEPVRRSPTMMSDRERDEDEEAVRHEVERRARAEPQDDVGDADARLDHRELVDRQPGRGSPGSCRGS